MKTRILQLCLLLGFLPIALAAAERVLIDALEFGVVADGVTDDAASIQRMIDAARSQDADTAITLQFPASKRIYAKPYSRRHLFRLDGFKDLRIEGNDSVFLLHPDLRFMFATHCENLVVTGVNVDTTPSPTVEAVIVAMNRNGRELTLRLDEPERAGELSGPTGEDGEQSFFGMLWIPDTYTDVSYHYSVKGFETVPAAGDSEEPLTRLIGTRAIPELYLNRVRPGETRISLPVAGIAHRYGPGGMIIIDRCVNVHFEDVEVWSAPWFAYQLFRNTGDLVFRRAHIRPQPGSGRITSVWRDGFHVKGNAGNLLFEDCILVGMNDDAFNVSTHNWRVVDIIDPQHVRIQQRFPLQLMPLLPGGMLQVLSPDGQVRIGEARIAAVKGLPTDDSAYDPGQGDDHNHPHAPELEIRIEDPLPGVEVGSVVWDAHTANPAVVIRNCVIRQSCRFQSAVVLEYNDIVGLLWFYGEDLEGPLPSGSIVRNNIIKRGRGNPTEVVTFHGGMRVSPPPSSRIVPQHKDAFPLTDIAIENNRIYGELVIDRVHGVSLKNNVFPEGLESIRISDSFDVLGGE